MSELTREEALVALSRTRPVWPGWRYAALMVGVYGAVQAVARLLSREPLADVLGVLLGSATAGVLIVTTGLLWHRRASRRLDPAALTQARVLQIEHGTTRGGALLGTDDGVRARVVLGGGTEVLQQGATVWCIGLEPQGATRIVVRGADGAPNVVDVAGPTTLEWDPNWRERL